MRTLDAFVLLSAVAGVFAADDPTVAAVVYDNPVGAKYMASFSDGVKGRVLAGSDPFGVGVAFHVQLSGLPEGEGPFSYHLHKEPVPEDGNCTGTSGHLDPYGRGGDPACDSSAPATCEVGDLSGKYGKLDGVEGMSSFLDLYSALNPESVAFFGNRSFVIHNAAGTRIACASFEEMADADDEEAGDEMDGEEEDDC